MKTIRHLFTALCSLLLQFSATAAPGDLDPLDADVVGAYVYVMAVQPDGKTIIAGVFTSVLGVPRSNIARLNADGTLDMGFDPNANGNVITCVAVQPDGKMIIGGGFTSVLGVPRRYVARLNADGILDTAFDPNPTGPVLCLALQADGKVLLGGYFLAMQPNGAVLPTSREYIARVNADGTLDMGFDPKPNNLIVSIVVQVDGDVLLCGTFTSLQPNGAASPIAHKYIARLKSGGALDMGFDPMPNDSVSCLALQADGKVLLGGFFTCLQPNGAAFPTSRQFVGRLGADGTLDAGFDPNANAVVNSLALQPDGKVLLGGAFSTLQPNGAVSPTARSNVARVSASGMLDVGFDPRVSSILRAGL